MGTVPLFNGSVPVLACSVNGPLENQQTKPTYDAESGNRTRDTLVEGERSHHCANLVPLSKEKHSN